MRWFRSDTTPTTGDPPWPLDYQASRSTAAFATAWQLGGEYKNYVTKVGDCSLFYNVLRASNGEVAGLPTVQNDKTGKRAQGWSGWEQLLKEVTQ